MKKGIKVECAQRTGANSGDRPMPIVIKFLWLKDKMAVLERGHELKGTIIFLNEDYTEALCQRWKELIPAMKAKRGKGNIAYIRYNRHMEMEKKESGKRQAYGFVTLLTHKHTHTWLNVE